MLKQGSFSIMSKVALIALMLLGLPLKSMASAYYLPSYSAGDLGEANAGGAALANDASTNFTNAAGLPLLAQQQIVLSAIGLINPVQFSGTTGAPFLNGTYYTQTGTASSHASTIIPAFYYALPFAGRWAFGFGLSTPYGLGDEYNESSILRYDVIDAKLVTENVSPSIAYKITDQLSAGVGLDALYFNLNEKYASFTPPNDSLATLKGSGWGYGWHGGLLYQFTPQTRVGLNYRSGIVDTVTGNSHYYLNSGPYAGNYASNDLQANVHLPPITTLSAYHNLTQQWAVMGSIDYMEWSVYKNIHLYNVATPYGAVSVNLPQNYRDSWRYALGTSYQLTPQWKLKTGVEYDQTPINATYRDQMLPGADRYGVGIGAGYQATKNVGLDISYYHAFFENVSIQYINPATGVSTNGSSKSSADALGLQVKWNIV